jgi:hypothetical protein
LQQSMYFTLTTMPIILNLEKRKQMVSKHISKIVKYFWINLAREYPTGLPHRSESLHSTMEHVGCVLSLLPGRLAHKDPNPHGSLVGLLKVNVKNKPMIRRWLIDLGSGATCMYVVDLPKFCR